MQSVITNNGVYSGASATETRHGVSDGASGETEGKSAGEDDGDGQRSPDGAAAG